MKQEDRTREPENVVWQTRTRKQTEFEQRLSLAMEKAFSEGVTELDELVAHLNGNKVHDEDDVEWTAESFCAVMAELA